MSRNSSNFLKLTLFAESRVLYQKRLKKERKARKRLQDQLELEMKRRLQCEDALKTTSADTLRMINGESSSPVACTSSASSTCPTPPPSLQIAFPSPQPAAAPANTLQPPPQGWLRAPLCN
ncbi:hypothetical protein J437_LFUL015956 [Ladona fulva]|uniref:Uncharacterized protein n=1 Tax=Ladona fulva TaxID=123851 RepID=A0A8K0KI55_LADFU|nr:hypothetical protein J437_LFUL015956 [Ladona fulva]